MMERCSWAEKEVFHSYHDSEWGVPTHDDRILFEFLLLEGAQAGLSWETVLKKRGEYRKVFCEFDPKKVASFTQQDQKELLKNPGIIRNRLKIASAIRNAQVFLDIQKEFGSFDAYIWGFTDGEVIQHTITSTEDIPTTSDVSDRVSRDLKKRGCSFVGSTIMYAYLQAVGIVNDHEITCPFR